MAHENIYTERMKCSLREEKNRALAAAHGCSITDMEVFESSRKAYTFIGIVIGAAMLLLYIF